MKRQSGLGIIAVIVVLVVLSTLAASIIALGTTQQMTSAQDLRSANALQAANAGIEMALYRALSGGDWSLGQSADLCPAGGATGSKGAVTDSTLVVAGFHVTVNAECWQYNEQTLNASGAAVTATQVYQIWAIACPSAHCPSDADATSPAYVERSRVVIATN